MTNLVLITSNFKHPVAFDSGSSPLLDRQQAEAHVAALAGTPDAVVDLRLIHDANKAAPAVPLLGRLSDHWQTILSYQAVGYGCFITLNEMDGAGRGAGNVRSIRAHVVDLDDVATAAQSYQRALAADPAPSFAVVSSPGKCHVYWSVEPYEDPARFTVVQRKLATLYHGDASVIDTPRVMRLAGTLHCKRPDAPSLVSFHALPTVGRRVTLEALETALQGVKASESGSATSGRYPLGTLELAAPSLAIAVEALNDHDPNDLDLRGDRTARGSWLAISAAFKQAVWTHATPEEALSIWQEWCAQYVDNDPAENRKQWNSLRDSKLGWPQLVRPASNADAVATFGLVRRFPPVSLAPAPGAPALPSPVAFFAASDLQGAPVPQRIWLVDGMIPSGTVTLLGGDGGTGKSLLALQLAASVALGGRPWIGQMTRAGTALFISAEDDRAELHRRIADVARANGAELSDLRGLTLSSLAGENALLATLAKSGALEPTALFRTLDDRIAETRPAVVILDTLADLFPGNENDRAQARQFVGMLRGLAIRHECAVLLLAHPSLSGMTSGQGTSGSTGWNNSVRSRLYLSRIIQEGYEANPDARKLEVKKSNYGRTGRDLTLTYQRGTFVADLAEAGPFGQIEADGKAERVFLKLLTQFTVDKRYLNENHAPKKFAEHPDAEGCTKRALKSAMENLFRSKKIAQSIIRENGRDRTVIIINQP